tara:strand:- start:78838 stop:80418 length:1581 start_codon:yes stop_codon:yes gene_type:complete
MDIIKKFNLPAYVKGKSFSEASALIAKRFEDRNSPEDVATLNDLQGRLQQAQEHVKSVQEARTKPTHQMPDGSVMNGAQHPQQSADSIPAGIEGAEPLGSEPASNQFAPGGGLTQVDPDLAGEAGKTGGPGAGAYLGAASTAMDLANMAFGPTGIDKSGASAPPDVPSQGASAASGAMKGAQAGLAFGPWGAAIGGVVGGAAGLIGGGKAQKEAQEAEFNYDLSQHNQASNSYKGGGKLLANMYDEGGHAHPHTDPNNEDLLTQMRSGIRDAKFAQIGVGENALDGIEFRDKQAELDQFNTSFASDLTKTEGIDSDPVTNTNTNTDTNSAKFNPAELLRYAPAAMNIAQLANLKKPDKVGLDRLGNRYNEQRVDERGLQNTIQEGTLNQRDAILSSSGGSGSAARANLLASQLQGTKALSQAQQQATGENRQDKRNAQQFNLGVDQANIGQSNKEKSINLELQAGYQTNKSKLMSQLGDDLGGIGQEELFKRYPELAGLSYDSKGRHLASEKAKKDAKKAKRKQKN